MISDFLALYDFLQKNIDKLTTLGALFNDEGIWTEGDKEIEIERIPTERDDVWFYRVIPIEGYIFIPIPVTPCRLEYAPNGQNLSTDVYRFTSSNLSAVSRPNLLVGFSVIGYQPKQLLERLKK